LKILLQGGKEEKKRRAACVHSAGGASFRGKIKPSVD
jgi:hypothetical protein